MGASIRRARDGDRESRFRANDDDDDEEEEKEITFRRNAIALAAINILS